MANSKKRVRYQRIETKNNDVYSSGLAHPTNRKYFAGVILENVVIKVPMTEQTCFYSQPDLG